MPKRKEVFRESTPPRGRPLKRPKKYDNDSDSSVPHKEITCSCRKTGCLKSYCECLKRGVTCSKECKCQNCKNFVGSEHLKAIQEKKAKKAQASQVAAAKKKKASAIMHPPVYAGTVFDSIARDQAKKDQVNQLMTWVGSQNEHVNARELGTYVLRGVQRDAHIFAEQMNRRMLEAHRGTMTTTTTTTTTTTAKTPSTPKHSATDHDGADPTLSPDTMSLLCDETDAVQEASRPHISGAPTAVMLRNRELNASVVINEAERAKELKLTLQKKVLTTFRDHLSQIVRDIRQGGGSS